MKRVHGAVHQYMPPVRRNDAKKQRRRFEKEFREKAKDAFWERREKAKEAFLGRDYVRKHRRRVKRTARAKQRGRLGTTGENRGGSLGGVRFRNASAYGREGTTTADPRY